MDAGRVSALEAVREERKQKDTAHPVAHPPAAPPVITTGRMRWNDDRNSRADARAGSIERCPRTVHRRGEWEKVFGGAAYR